MLRSRSLSGDRAAAGRALSPTRRHCRPPRRAGGGAAGLGRGAGLRLQHLFGGRREDHDWWQIGAEASLNKIFWSELRAMHRTAMQLLGSCRRTQTTCRWTANGWVGRLGFSLSARFMPVQAEVQRNIIAERLLAFPGRSGLMDFRLSEDQLIFAEGCATIWPAPTAPRCCAGLMNRRKPRRFRDLAGAGRHGPDGACAPEAQGGLAWAGRSGADRARMWRAALAEPLVDTAFVGVPWLVGRRNGQLDAVAAGTRRIVSAAINPWH